jgi:hypothetical protein
MACIQAAINGAKSLRFPDSAFIVNIDDFPVCTVGRCPLPVFTMYKKWDASRGGNFETNEVLMPVSVVMGGGRRSGAASGARRGAGLPFGGAPASPQPWRHCAAHPISSTSLHTCHPPPLNPHPTPPHPTPPHPTPPHPTPPHPTPPHPTPPHPTPPHPAPPHPTPPHPTPPHPPQHPAPHLLADLPPQPLHPQRVVPAAL